MIIIVLELCHGRDWSDYSWQTPFATPILTRRQASDSGRHAVLSWVPGVPGWQALQSQGRFGWFT